MIVAILDNYFFLESVFLYYRIPGSPGRQPDSAARWSEYGEIPTVVAAARFFNLVFPILSVPFALLYYVKNGELWFDSQLHYFLLLVAIEHALAAGHWLASQLATTIDRRRLGEISVGESAFSRELKAQAKAAKELASQENKLKLAVMEEQQKWKTELERAKLESSAITQHGEATRSELIQRLTETTASLRAHWFQPLKMRSNLQLTIYWTIEQHLLAKRYQQAQLCLPTPVCDENEIYLSRYYLPKRRNF